jgi:CubicO group peptidase (beta-lactamase class C family)
MLKCTNNNHNQTSVYMSTYKKKLLLLVITSIVLTIKVFAQSLPDSTIKKIDSLFIKWNTANSPGCTVGIVRNDSLIFSKGYGMANLEYAISNEPQTLFHMASVSKQFTAFSIVLLARKGKLILEDDIHKWLPWFPALKEKITIRNLLNHTSGIRDQWQLLAISGTRLDDVITQDQIIKILSKQQALNFKPGDKYSYSNSGFTMLAEIVKAVSGQTLRQFTDSAIFKPLGMTSTHFHDDYTEIEKNRSYSYDRKDSAHFTNAVLSYSVAGATSLFTNINDMSKWIRQIE